MIKTGLLHIGCAIAAVFSGVMVFFESYLILKAKNYSKERISKYRPTNAWLNRRKFRTISMKHRAPVLINDIKIKRGVWVDGYYYIEEHDATNLHNDFSIIVNKKVYRMARAITSETNRKLGYLGIFPHLGEKTGWIRQPEHFLNEVPNPSIILEGYGKGTCKVIKEGRCFVMISDNNNMHVIFEGIDGVYVFIETKGNQVIMMRKHHEGSWFGKHQMDTSNDLKYYIDNSDYGFFAKKDGAAIEWHIVKAANGDKYIRVQSYRQNMRIYKDTRIVTQIDHTYRLKMLDKKVSPDTPLAAGRGELWIAGQEGRLNVARLMNSSHYLARSYNYDTKIYIHDILEYDGENVEHLPYQHKLELMHDINKHDSRFLIPEYAFSSKGKEKLWNICKNEHATDGIVAWNMNEPNAQPIKIKFTHEKEGWHSATIVDIEPQIGIHSNKYAYPILRNENNVEFKISGKGLTNERKMDLYNNPDKYIGTEVRYSADSHFNDTTGKPFQPTLQEWYIAPSDVLSEFNPDFTACEMEQLGVLANQYKHDNPNYKNYFGVNASQKTWPEDWKAETAPEGWYQWYKGYCEGVRTADDVRQIKRWKSFKSRHYNQLKKADPTLQNNSIQTKRRQALLNWGIDSNVNEDDIKRAKNICMN